MASIFDGIDMADPCALGPKLQEIYDRLLAGEQVVEARFGTDTKRWQPTDMKALAARIAQLNTECREKSGQRSRRFAIRAGFRRY
ncbi:hypothetical protein [Aurantimonas coralicida]|uniref:hypothetical protein n=1 Tax=Aurantimonas coralicida TaxID=182270 RepID=UPI001E4297CF|nr:hypothetical protein [Aurantimonas coralicida]MCD1644318.1 hypothetical protein [Aurantimonas coralicida]